MVSRLPQRSTNATETHGVRDQSSALRYTETATRVRCVSAADRSSLRPYEKLDEILGSLVLSEWPLCASRAQSNAPEPRITLFRHNNCSPLLKTRTASELNELDACFPHELDTIGTEGKRTLRPIAEVYCPVRSLSHAQFYKKDARHTRSALRSQHEGSILHL